MLRLLKATSFWNPIGTPKWPAGTRHAEEAHRSLCEEGPGRPQRAEYRDGHTRGLVLRITPNGKKTWAVFYRRKSDARKRRYTIGAYPAFSLNEARDRAQEILAAVARGEDPAGQVQTPQCIPHLRSNSRTPGSTATGGPTRFPARFYDDQLMLNLRNQSIHWSDEGRRSLQARHHSRSSTASRIAEPVCARTGSLLFCDPSTGGGFAEDLIKSDPTQGVRPRTIERPRDRVLTDEEAGIFWHSLDSAPMGEGGGDDLAARACHGTADWRDRGDDEGRDRSVSVTTPSGRSPARGGRTRN